MNCLCATTRLAARRLTRIYERALLPVHLTPAQFELLAELATRPDRSQSNLADALSLDQTTLSRNLKPLLARRLLARFSAPNDRRQFFYALTPTGHDLLAEAVPLWQTTQQTMQAALGPDWLSTRSSLARLNQALNNAIGL